jgi:hypothetical protein
MSLCAMLMGFDLVIGAVIGSVVAGDLFSSFLSNAA